MHQIALSGVWQGTFDSLRLKGHVVGLVTEKGDGQFVTSTGVHLVGHVDGAGEAVTARLRAYQGTQPPADYDFAGEVVPKKSWQGRYQSKLDAGDFDLTYSNLYERAPSLKAIAHGWGSTTYGMQVDGKGQLAGRDTGGCTYEGTLGIIDPRFNAYELELAVKGCLYRGSYAGLATLVDARSKGDLLLFGISGGKFSRSGYLVRGGELGTNATIGARIAVAKARLEHRRAITGRKQGD